MISITQSLEELLKSNYFLQFGITNQLLNLTQVARFLQPLVEARTQKDIKISALKMNLSRLQKKFSKIMPREQNFKLNNLSVVSSLCTITFLKSDRLRTDLNDIYSKIKNKNGFINLTEGTDEITLITEKKYQKAILEKVASKPKYFNDQISSIKVSFDESYYYSPGIIYVIFQQLTMQGINIIEISSVFSELILFLEDKDVKTAFDSLFYQFMRE